MKIQRAKALMVRDDAIKYGGNGHSQGRGDSGVCLRGLWMDDETSVAAGIRETEWRPQSRPKMNRNKDHDGVVKGRGNKPFNSGKPTSLSGEGKRAQVQVVVIQMSPIPPSCGAE